jgi:WD40 repeat protein
MAQYRQFALFFFVLIFAIASGASAQPDDYNHPELEWFTIKTEHFEVHYHAGAERTAREIARIAEEIYEPVTGLYQYVDDKKFHFIIRDHDDYSNGAAYYYDDKIEIWASPMDFELRGTHPWLLNVVTHEFAHMISLDQAKKFGKRIPAFYLQYIGYEDETRPDVLYGFPNTIVSFPVAGAVIPPWFAEGIAQYQTAGTAYDFWDTHRDMILRSAVLEDKLPSYREISSFGRTSLGNEQVYNSGFSLVSYIAAQHGSHALAQLTKKMSSPLRVTFASAVRSALGKSEDELYQEWKSFLKSTYEAGIREIRGREEQGILLEDEGFGNFYPAWSPAKNEIAFISNKGSERFSPSSVILHNLDTNKSKVLKGNVEYSPSFSPDGNRLAYVKRRRYDRYGSIYYDLYICDLASAKETRVSKGARLRNPDWSPDGREIVCVSGRDGTDNLMVLDVDARSLRSITSFEDGEQIFRPSWSPDGAKIVFDISTGHGRDLAIMERDAKNFTYLIRGSADARNPVFHPSGQSIFFSWDKTGIFNIYEYDLDSKKTEPVTNVLGGAFMPDFDPERGLVYSLYTGDGYKIARISNPTKVEENRYLAREHMPRTAPVNDLTQARDGHNGHGPDNDDGPQQSPQAEKYKNTYGVVNVLPRVMIDYETVKLGSYFTSSEMLNKYSILGGFAVNHSFDMDLFGIIEYRNFYPTIFLEIYNQIRHTEDGTDKFKYNLLEADVGLELKLNNANTVRGMFVYSRYDGKITFQQGGREQRFGYTYFLGSDFALQWRHEAVSRSSTSSINPRAGRRFALRYDRQHNKFIEGITINPEHGTLEEVFTTYNYNQFTADWDEYFSLPWQHGLQLRVKAGYIDKPIDSFFNFFAGGLIGLKGYPYYSIEGRKFSFTSLTYRFKISDKLGLYIPPLQFDKLYAGVFFEYGNAWNDGSVVWSDFKKDIGLQVRADAFAFYNFPMRFFFDAAYGIDEVTNRGFKYGKEWRFYFGITFDYID